MRAATATTGFFQERPTLKNQFSCDLSLQKALEYFMSSSVLAEAKPELEALGDKVLQPHVFEWMADAELNLPYVVHQDVFGHASNKLITSAGWKNLKKMGIEEGLIATAYDRPYKELSRIVSFAKCLIFSPSSSMVTCPFAMTDGVARLTELFGPFEETGNEVFQRLTSTDPEYAWTSGQWMTERPGGSDVSGTETIATKSHKEKQYLINGFKWFSSATDSQVCALLAKCDGENKLTCFLGRVETDQGQVRINRLKKKFGTGAVPTAELELKNLQAEIIGPRGRGVATIATVLNITRVYSAIGSLSFMRRALHIAREYSLVRKVFGKLLCEIPGHVKVLATEEVRGRGFLFLNFYACKILGAQEYYGRRKNKYDDQRRIKAKHEEQLLRVIPGVCKAITCKQAIGSISECMEALGGVGYLEHDVEFNIARLLRDAQVNPIWEGTTNTLADDFVRHMMKNGEAFKDAMDWFLDDTLKNNDGDESVHDHPHSPEVPQYLGMNQTASVNSSSNLKHLMSQLQHKIRNDWYQLSEVLITDRAKSTMTDAASADRTTLLRANAREYMLEFGRIMVSALLLADVAYSVTGSNSSITDSSNTTNATRLTEIETAVAVESAARWAMSDLNRSVLEASIRLPSYYEEYKNTVSEDLINKLIVYRQLPPSSNPAGPGLNYTQYNPKL